MSAELIGFDKAFQLVTSLPKKTRFAASNAINDTLKEVQKETADTILPHAFTLRGRGRQWWEPGQRMGFNLRPFSKPSTLEGIMGSQADWLKLQEHGGRKQVAGHRLAIPAPDYKAKTDIMRREIKPRAILKDYEEAKRELDRAKSDLKGHSRQPLRTRADKQTRHDLKLKVRSANRTYQVAHRAFKEQQGRGAGGSKAFIATMKGGFTGIFKRLGPARTPLKLLFSLTKYAGLHPVLGFEKAAHDLADERYDANFTRRFLQELR